MISYPATLVLDVTGMLTEENMPFEEETEPAPSMLSKIQDHAS